MRVGLNGWTAAIMELSLMDKAAALKDALSYPRDGRIVGAQSGVIAALARSLSAQYQTLHSDAVRPRQGAA